MGDRDDSEIVNKISCLFLKKLNPFRREPSAESRCICRNRKFNCNLSYKLHPNPSTSKTLWPVSVKEFYFLPEFKVCDKKLKDYQIQEFIAHGSFGQVHKVQNIEGTDTYALKILGKSKILVDNYIKQLKDEISIQTLVGHSPFIVTCYTQWQDRGNIYLLSEFVCNGELFNKIKSFSYKLVQIYVVELVIALDFLHNAGIIYRDIKSENILLDQEYHIKITDFGLSKWLKLGSKTFTICGTANFMAPEILEGKGYSHAVDYWSLGILVHLMLTGKFPQTSDNAGNDEEDFKDFDGIFRTNDDEIDNLCHPNATKNIIDASSNHKTNGASHLAAIKTQNVIDFSRNNLNSESDDLLRRLLEKNPQYRLKSLLALTRIAMFKNYNFKDIEKRKISPKKLLMEVDQ